MQCCAHEFGNGFEQGSARSPRTATSAAPTCLGSRRAELQRRGPGQLHSVRCPVSYTHLTLPTICSV
eukprot:6166594-Alexandrium_andersonii.AAC.1